MQILSAADRFMVYETQVKSLARTLELVQNFNAVPLCMKPASIHFNVDFFRRDGQRKVLAEPMPTF